MDIINLSNDNNYNALGSNTDHTANYTKKVVLMFNFVFHIFGLFNFTNTVIFIDRDYEYSDESANHADNLDWAHVFFINKISQNSYKERFCIDQYLLEIYR